jgi:hypothetical protein
MKIETIFKDTLQGMPEYFEMWKTVMKDYTSVPRSVVPIYTIPKDGPLFGVEIEIEKTNGLNKIFAPSGWLFGVKPDHSLRDNGLEYITTPLQIEQTVQSLQLFYSICNTLLPERRPTFSWRTSIHVHVNVRELEFEQFLNFLLLYCLFEKSLFKYTSADRRNGNFTVPLIEDDALLRSIMDRVNSFLSRKPNGKYSDAKEISYLIDRWDKYSALGCFRLRDLGTLEFRHLEGTYDFNKVVGWLLLIYKLYAAACRIPLKTTVESISMLNTVSNYSLMKMDIFREYNNLLHDLKEDLIVSVCELKKYLFYTNLGNLFRKSPTTGLNKYIAKLTQRKKKADQLGKDSRREELLEIYLEDFGMYKKFSTKKAFSSLPMSWDDFINQQVVGGVNYIATTNTNGNT